MLTRPAVPCPHTLPGLTHLVHARSPIPPQARPPPGPAGVCFGEGRFLEVPRPHRAPLQSASAPVAPILLKAARPPRHEGLLPDGPGLLDPPWGWAHGAFPRFGAPGPLPPRACLAVLERCASPPAAQFASGAGPAYPCACVRARPSAGAQYTLRGACSW
uniref:Uncharacterized protein n=1 Tax=Rousettus aegyptiacus TaxID=9407 RepID=A0A7J8GA56_ROUAE|nr:hypothetical protein HJG63_011582 [Rousettus aegyptiacus]